MRFIPLLIFLFACTSSDKAFEPFGAEVSDSNSLEMAEFLALVSTESSTFKVKGIIEEVCQMKGCWMTLKNDQGVNIRVTFRDYGFFVPKDISGKEVVIEGTAKKEVLEEDLARHYADDSGKVYDESMRNTISFVASGVLVAKG